jgi:hypothetical protein
LEKQLNFQAQYWAETAPRLQPTGRGGLPRAVSRKAGWATAWQPSPVGQTACAASCNACAPRVRRRGHHVQRACGMARWRARRRLSGGSTVARCCRRSRGGHGEGDGHGGEGRGAPEQRVDAEAAGLLRWSSTCVEGSCNTGVEGEREISLQFREWRSSEGSHWRGGTAATVGQSPARRRGSGSEKPTRRTPGRWGSMCGARAWTGETNDAWGRRIRPAGGGVPADR